MLAPRATYDFFGVPLPEEGGATRVEIERMRRPRLGALFDLSSGSPPASCDEASRFDHVIDCLLDLTVDAAELLT